MTWQRPKANSRGLASSPPGLSSQDGQANFLLQCVKFGWAKPAKPRPPKAPISPQPHTTPGPSAPPQLPQPDINLGISHYSLKSTPSLDCPTTTIRQYGYRGRTQAQDRRHCRRGRVQPMCASLNASRRETIAKMPQSNTAKITISPSLPSMSRQAQPWSRRSRLLRMRSPL